MGYSIVTITTTGNSDRENGQWERGYSISRTDIGLNCSPTWNAMSRDDHAAFHAAAVAGGTTWAQACSDMIGAGMWDSISEDDREDIRLAVIGV